MVVKEQVFNYGGDDDTQTTKYYYNQARTLEYIDGEENNQDLKFTYDSLGRSQGVTPPRPGGAVLPTRAARAAF